MAHKADIPTQEEITQLPRWARVAFAARCARHVQPVFGAAWSDAPQKYIDALEEAISFAETLAAKRPTRLMDNVPTGDAAAARQFTEATWTPDAKAALAAQAAVRAPDAGEGAARAARSAQFAAEIAKLALRVEGEADRLSRSERRADSVKAHFRKLDIQATLIALRAVEAATFEKATIPAIRRDFEWLRQAAAKGGWTEKTCVPPELFGSMWPHGELEGWPSTQAQKAKFYEQAALELYIDPGNAPKKTIQAVLQAVSDLHIAAGGLGLEFVNHGDFIYRMEKVTK